MGGALVSRGPVLTLPPPRQGLAWAVLGLAGVLAVDRSNFKTCEQSGFCRWGRGAGGSVWWAPSTGLPPRGGGLCRAVP